MADFDFKLWGTQVKKRFAACENVASLRDELEKLFAETEVLLQHHDEGDRSLIACHAGCQDCCVVNVSITLLEGLVLSRFILQWRDVGQTEVKAKLDSLWRVVRGLEDDERLMVRKKCAFLDEQGCCTVYPVRPLFCRSVTSTDVESCRAAVTGPLFGETQSVIMHQFQLQLYKISFTGVADGLEQAGLDGRSFPLSGLVRYLLAHPDRDEELLTTSSLNWDHLYP